MASGDEHLLSCFMIGSEGSLVSLAIIIPEAIIGLYKSVLNKNLEEAIRLSQYYISFSKSNLWNYACKLCYSKIKNMFKIAWKNS